MSQESLFRTFTDGLTHVNVGYTSLILFKEFVARFWLYVSEIWNDIGLQALQT